MALTAVEEERLKRKLRTGWEKVYDLVEATLQHYPSTRNNPNKLVYKAWQLHKEHKTGNDILTENDIGRLPSVKSILRRGREIQNDEERFLPDEETQQIRDVNNDVVSELMQKEFS